MKILLTGGGTGGHITPLLAVAHELKRQNPDHYIVYVGERNGKFTHIIKDQLVFDEVKTIFAGKFRRYHGSSWLHKLLDIRTNFLNIRDFFYFCIGTFQSLILVRVVRSDIVFLKGGFVGVPVGLASAAWKVPFVTHDSDATPGLANRLVARWAACHATGLPTEFYAYPQHKMKYVGVLTGETYRFVTEKLKREYKQILKLTQTLRVLFVTGGSLGSRTINAAMAKVAPQLLEKYEDLMIIHQVGKGNEQAYGTFTHQRLQVLPFVQGMHLYSGVADVIVSRAGANTLAEFGVQGKACIVIPHPYLAGGHQLRNAEYFSQRDAIVVVNEGMPQATARELQQRIVDLLKDSSRRQKLAQRLRALTATDAAHQLAVLLLEVANHNQKRHVP